MFDVVFAHYNPGMLFPPRLLCVLCVWAVIFSAQGAPKLPPNFTITPVANQITGATALAIAPDGRIFVCEQTGALRLVKDDKLLDRPFLTVQVDRRWERGVIGVALDPDFPVHPYVYVNYIAPTPYPHHVIARFTADPADPDRALPDSQKILLEGDDQTQLPKNMKKTRMAILIDGHQGGAIHFGPADGRLYIAIGEQTTETPAQDLDSFRGKILRINPDGSIPADNPFYNRAAGKYRAIWAVGNRNPFCFAFQPETGRMFVNDVGGAKEEINEGKPGANFGWPIVEHGQHADPDDPHHFTDCVFSYPVASITGGAFCPQDLAAFPKEWRGRYFFADFMRGFIQTLDPEDLTQKPKDFVTGLVRITDIAFHPNGSLYVLDRNAWVIDKQFKPNTGTLYRITPPPNP
jgi:glucose/arabinose dehydrogenase